jgi:AraC-like DNA-binding protein
VESWLPDPAPLVGRRIARDSKWGRAFSPIVSQLTPELATASPLPHGILVDQVGALLALMAAEDEARAMPHLLKRIRDCIEQRYGELELTADDVAASLNVPPRTLHRVLAASNLTFASLLLDMRISVALPMLTSPAFDQRTTAEISRIAGFLTPAYFARVVRRRTGHTPAQLRRATH